MYRLIALIFYMIHETSTHAQETIRKRITEKSCSTESFQDNWVEYEEYYNDYNDLSRYYDVDTY